MRGGFTARAATRAGRDVAMCAVAVACGLGAAAGEGARAEEVEGAAGLPAKHTNQLMDVQEESA